MNLKDLPLGAKFSRKDYQCTPYIYIKVEVVEDSGSLYGLTGDNTVVYFGDSWDVEWLDRPEVTFADLKVGEKFKCSEDYNCKGRILTKIDRQQWKPDGFDGAAIDEDLRLFGLKSTYIVDRV